MTSIPEDASGSQWVNANRTMTTKSTAPPSPSAEQKWSGSPQRTGSGGGAVLKSIGIDDELQKKLAAKAKQEKEAESGETRPEATSEKSAKSSASAPPLAKKTSSKKENITKMSSTKSLPQTSPMADPQSPTKATSTLSSSKVHWAPSPEDALKRDAPPPPPSPPSPWRIQSTPDTKKTGPVIASTPSEDEAADQIVILGRYLPSKDPIRCSDTEIIIPALDLVVAENASSSPVVLQFLTDPRRVVAELNSRSGLDPSYVLGTKAAFADEGATAISGLKEDADVPVRPRRGLTEEVKSLNLGCEGHSYLLVLEDHGETLERHMMNYPKKNLDFARDVVADMVVGLIVLHTEGRVHRDLKTRNVVSTKSGDSRWKLKGFGSCTASGETGDAKTSHWAYWPPEIAALYEKGGDEAIENCQADSTWDLWSLGCVLYRLVFGTDMWNASAEEKIDDRSIGDLSGWSVLEVLARAEKEFPIKSRTDQERAAIDLVSRLLAPTPSERKQNFEMGIISVHQHEFLEGKPLDPPNLEKFELRQNLLTQSRFEQERFNALTGCLSLEEKWELNRARDVLLMGALEPANVHVPTNYVILKKPLPEDPESTTEAVQACLYEGMRWVDKMNDIGPLVLGALDGNVSAVGRFWSKITGMFEGSYVYLYFVDDLTGEPVRGDAAAKFAGNSPYPIPIMTWSDSLPKLLPLMHLTMRSMALYHGAAGIARMFGSTLPLLPEKMRSAVQAKIDELKHESTGSPFGPFAEDIELARLHRERFLQGDHARCKCLREYVRFLERKGFVPGEDFASLRRLADERGRAIWTTLMTAEDVKDAIAHRADERLKEEMKLWGDEQEYLIVDLKEKNKQQLADLSKAKNDLEKAEQNKVSPSKKEENQRIIELKTFLADARNELQKSKERVKALEEENARQTSLTPAPPPVSQIVTAVETAPTPEPDPLPSPPKTATQYMATSSNAPSKGSVASYPAGNASVSSNSTLDQEESYVVSKDEIHKKKKKWASVTGKKKK